MMFSERLEYDKYYFQHLQGTVRVQKPVQFRGFSANRPFSPLCTFEDLFWGVSRLSKIFFSKKKKLFWKQFFFGDCGRATLPRFKIWRQSEKIWPLSAQHRYVKELTQNVHFWVDIVRTLADPITCMILNDIVFGFIYFISREIAPHFHGMWSSRHQGFEIVSVFFSTS